ncbi:hypothetical protein [Brevibacillus laterosporus]|uniref:hypothetical protein n=1 Tax=Brevibacillus laterosporus TaxID=1465 RepID=UPI0026519173|nr:hypothetical protein [Brevibacillus laterosporus]MDN9008803.1 hypothetical protein [Brevibacillus laterosporus]MDO0940910.1 hypothetical protein [Brevibacillus laterosporus]
MQGGYVISTILDLAIAICLTDCVSSASQRIISQIKLMEHATDQVQSKMNRLKNMAFGGGAFAVGGILGFNLIANAADEVVTRAGNLQVIMIGIIAQKFGLSRNGLSF